MKTELFVKVMSSVGGLELGPQRQHRCFHNWTSRYTENNAKFFLDFPSEIIKIKTKCCVSSQCKCLILPKVVFAGCSKII